MRRYRCVKPISATVVLLVLLSLPVLAQCTVSFEHTTWVKTFGGRYYDEGTSIVAVEQAGFVMSGRTEGFGVLQQDEEVWLVRCDENGNHLWNKTYGGGMKYGGFMSTAHHSVTVIKSSSGGFLITSHTRNFGPGDVNGWLIHTDDNGEHLWNHTYGGAPDYYLGRSVVCSDGGYLSAGFSENISAGIIDGWVLRTDVNGNHLWNYTYGDSDVGEAFIDVIEVSGGGFLMTGFLGGFNHFEDRSGTPPDVWLCRIDANGNHLWNNTYGGNNVDAPNRVIQCANGDFAICGGTISYGSEDLDAWVVRTDSDGQHLWNRTYGGDDIEAAFGIAECQNGGFAIFTLTYTDALGVSDAWFVRSDSTGQTIWEQRYQGPDFEQFWGGTIVDGNFVAIGVTQSIGAGMVDMWIVKIPDKNPSSGLGTIVILGVGIGAVIVVLVIVLMRRRT